MPGFPKGTQSFLGDDDEDEYGGYIVRVSYGCLRTSQEWHDWDSLHKWFDLSTRTWDLFPEPIPHTVLHYSHLLSANSPNYPPPSLPIASGDILPHELTWDHYRSSSKTMTFLLLHPLCPLHQWMLMKTESLFKTRMRTHILPQRVILWFRMKPLYPFTVYHTAFNMSRRYMFYASGESPKAEGRVMLDNAIVVYRARQEANMVTFSFWQTWNVLKLIRILTVFYATGIEWWFLWAVGTGQNYKSGARFSGITSTVPFGHSSVPDPDDSAESNDAAPLQASWCFSAQSHVCPGALTILPIQRQRWPRSLWHPTKIIPVSISQLTFILPVHPILWHFPCIMINISLQPLNFNFEFKYESFTCPAIYLSTISTTICFES